MKIDERGQIVIPKELRDTLGLSPSTEVDFRIEDDAIVLRKVPKKLALEKWTGYCAASLAELGVSSGDEFIAEVRGE
jgi:AbrB family looped-hinge helix DNA binding protein